LHATAQSMALNTPARPATDDQRLNSLRWRLGWAMACAASAAIVALILHAVDRPAVKPDSDVTKVPDRSIVAPLSGHVYLGLTAQPRPVAPEQVKIAVGTEIST